MLNHYSISILIDLSQRKEAQPGKSIYQSLIEGLTEQMCKIFEWGDFIIVHDGQEMRCLKTFGEFNSYMFNNLPNCNVSKAFKNVCNLSDLTLVIFDKQHAINGKALFCGIGKDVQDFCASNNYNWIEHPSQFDLQKIILSEKHLQENDSHSAPLFF